MLKFNGITLIKHAQIQWNNLNQACSNSNTATLNNLRVFGSNKGYKQSGQNRLSFPMHKEHSVCKISHDYIQATVC